MAIQVRRGKESELDISKAIPGEWLVSTDTRYVRMCFAPGIVLRMATYEAFEADMAQIQAILEEAKTIQEAVSSIQTKINDTLIVVEDYALLSASYAVGGTGTRENEDSDNARYYYEQTKQISQGINGIVPMGTVTFANLPTTDIVNNAMYNVSDEFTSDERFNDGGGIYYGPGNNVIWTAEGKWDVTASSNVTGIKGEAEASYRVGNVNITKRNIGLENVDNTSDKDKPISDATQSALDEANSNLQTKVPDSICNANGVIEKLFAKNLSNKVSFDWQAENGVMYIHVYIDSTLIAKIPEGTLALASSLSAIKSGQFQVSGLSDTVAKHVQITFDTPMPSPYYSVTFSVIANTIYYPNVMVHAGPDGTVNGFTALCFHDANTDISAHTYTIQWIAIPQHS